MAQDQDNPVDPFASEKYENPTLASWAKQAAGKDVDTIGQIARMAYGTAQIPQRAVEAAQGYQIGNPDTMNAGPFTDAAMLTVGAGAPMAEAGALGSAGGKLGTGAKAFLDTEVPVDIWKTDPKSMMPGQKVMAGPDGAVGIFKGVSPGGTTLVDWKAKPASFAPEKTSFKQAVTDAVEKFGKEAAGTKQNYWDQVKQPGPAPKTLLDAMPELKERIRPSVPDAEKARITGGYETPAYRGMKLYGNEPNPTHDPTKGHSDLYTTADPMLADMYSDYLSHHPGQEVPPGTFGEGATVAPLWIDTSKYHYADAQGAHWSNFNPKAIQEAKAQGKPGVIIDNVWDEPNSTHNLAGPKKIFVTFPDGLPTVKSKFATKFDPSSPNMMQGVGAIGIGGPAGYVSMAEPGQQQMAEKPQQGQDKGKSSGGSPTLSPGVAKFLMEFLKSNPDLAKEMSTRMQAVINGKQIQGQQGMGQKPPMPPGQQPPGGPQMPPQQPMQQPQGGMPKPPMPTPQGP